MTAKKSKKNRNTFLKFGLVLFILTKLTWSGFIHSAKRNICFLSETIFNPSTSQKGFFIQWNKNEFFPKKICEME